MELIQYNVICISELAAPQPFFPSIHVSQSTSLAMSVMPSPETRDQRGSLHVSGADLRSAPLPTKKKNLAAASRCGSSPSWQPCSRVSTLRLHAALG
ncbi:uncharacterized protein K441DRAFT_248176 [Cenococcum geophilum 1.58]|uniref:uncharacterized protein n=1 Tax=Cenococcum geophilum 1.58 TaxID=794803 RepID=UPI00358DF680|nr:hypothetical protein K441DRAFT_248176 [Cenococcum geophilum 1.58]